MKGQERLLGAVEDLVRRGRARGVGNTLITQRPAVLNKDVLTQVEVLVTLRMIAPQDRSAIDEWVKVHGTLEQRDELMRSLPSLPVGEAWFWSPGWLDLFRRARVRQRKTFDSSATPKVGMTPVPPRMLAEVDLSKLRERMAAMIEQAKADDPRELRRRIRALEQELARARAIEVLVPAQHAQPSDPVEVPCITDEQIGRIETAVREILHVAQELVAWGREMREVLVAARPVPPVRELSPAPRPQAPAVKRVNERSGEVPSLRLGERRMLEVLASRHPLRMTRTQIGTLSRLTPSGGTFTTYFGRLKRFGLVIEHSNGDVELTEAGLSLVGHDAVDVPRTPFEVQAMWRSVLRAGEARMLDALVSAYPSYLTRRELGEQTGIEPSGGTFGTYLGTLRRNGLAEVDGDMVRAGQAIFLVPA